MSLTSLIKRLEDIMRPDPGIDGTAQRLSQIVWILFLKIFDYKKPNSMTTTSLSSPKATDGGTGRLEPP